MLDRKCIKIDSGRPDPELLKSAAAMLAEGRAVVVPTSGLYGLAADIFNDGAVKEVFAIKARDLSKPLPVLVADSDQARQVVGPLDDFTQALMDSFWPGGVTFVVPAAVDLTPLLLAGGNTVAVRMVVHPVTAALLKVFGRPVTGTSANIAGGRAIADIAGLDNRILRKVALVLDAGFLPQTGPSTVVAVKDGAVEILRPGRVASGLITETALRLRNLG